MRRLLLIGCGDIALRAAPLLRTRYQLFGLLRDSTRASVLSTAGITPVMGDLDDRNSLGRLAGLADVVLHLAPPPDVGTEDTRMRHLLAALAQGRLPRRFIYISTSGVYGDCGGAGIDETHPIRPQNARARRRADAERQLRAWAGRHGVCAGILRVPGIYAAERLPLARLRSGTPAIVAEQDSYTNHIHADDLARILVAALWRVQPNRVYHASDDCPMKMGEYFDAVADACGLLRPPRIARAEAERVLPESLWSFMKESRRLANKRMKKELRVKLQYPAVREFLVQAFPRKSGA